MRTNLPSRIAALFFVLSLSTPAIAGEGNTTITNTNCSAISKRCTVTVTVIHFNADGTATIISVSEHQIEYVDAESPSTDP